MNMCLLPEHPVVEEQQKLINQVAHNLFMASGKNKITWIYDNSTPFLNSFVTKDTSPPVIVDSIYHENGIHCGYRMYYADIDNEIY